MWNVVSCSDCPTYSRTISRFGTVLESISFCLLLSLKTVGRFLQKKLSYQNRDCVRHSTQTVKIALSIRLLRFTARRNTRKKY